MKAHRVLVEEFQIDKDTREQDELVMLKKLNLIIIKKIKPKWERIVIQIWDEEREVIDLPRGGKQ